VTVNDFDHLARYGFAPDLAENEYPYKFQPGHQIALEYHADETVTLTCECSPSAPFKSWGDPNKVCAYRSQDPSRRDIQDAIDAHSGAV
jgi:hypothetical protein